MLTSNQKTILIALALDAIRLQKGLIFDHTEFDLYLDKPNTSSLCSVYIYSKRTDDNFKVRLYVKGTGNFSSVGTIIMTIEENYSVGPNGNIYVADCTLEEVAFNSLYHYLESPQFIADYITPINKILLENGTDAILAEYGIGYLVQDI